MRSGITTIVGLGTVTALFLAIMSVFYLQQIPTKADLERLTDDIQTEHGLYLSSAVKLEVKLERPAKEGDHMGLRVNCGLRPDIRQRPETVRVYLTRIADGILNHPEWEGKIAYVTVAHAAEPPLAVTRSAGEAGPRTPPK
ncbi:MAG TPA: hypothetical protein VIC87_16775 [Vicinamibacteria bacterium]